MMKAPKKQWVVVGTAAVLGLSGAVTTAALALNDAPVAEQAGAAITLTGGAAEDVTGGGAGADGQDVVDDSPESADSPDESPADSPDDADSADSPDDADSADSPASADSAN